MASIEDAVRGARTQSIFRDVNERVRRINEAFSVVVPLGEWVCECADQDCSVRVTMTHADYDAIRAVPTRFVVGAGDEHVFPEIEDVIARHEHYWVVEKLGEAAKVATSVDPRQA
jgi:hypothetical protein